MHRLLAKLHQVAAALRIRITAHRRTALLFTCAQPADELLRLRGLVRDVGALRLSRSRSRAEFRNLIQYY